MSFRLELPQYYTGDEQLRQVYAYLTRTVDRLNYALGFLDVPEASASAGVRSEDPANKSISIGPRSTNTQYPSSKAVYDYAVPQTRTVNGQALSDDVTLDADDVGAVPPARKINGHTLDADVDLDAGDVDAVPTDREINRHPLDADLTLAPADLGEAVYVTETGGNADGWRWRKWSDGTVEMWADGLPVTLGNAATWITDLVYQNGTITYPIAVANQHVQTQIVKPGDVTEINGIVLVAIKQSDGAQIRFVHKTASSKVYLDVYVRGTEVTEP